ncbi:MAG: TonB-dependent receptor, partial [Glaciecola sp.]
MNLGQAISLAVISSAAISSQSALAQQIEEIVISSPIRDSQAAAIEAKRQAFNVKDIISSDAIGRFPDQNLADSLGRLPGIAIERDQGQARFINFRGSPFRWTSIAFDGIDVLGAENGRIPRFDSFPSVITSSVEANKAITPDMPGEAVAGFVNIQTFSPFDREGFSLSLEGGMGEQNLGNGDVEKLNGRLSYSND